MPRRLQALLGSALLAAALAAAGCEDGATVYCSGVPCGSLAPIAAAPVPAPGAPGRTALSAEAFEIEDFEIGDAHLPSRHLAGWDGFGVSVALKRPAGDYVMAYGLRTPYEDFRTNLRDAVPQVRAGLEMVVRCGPITIFPAGGALAMTDVEFWLVNERGEASNHVHLRLTGS